MRSLARVTFALLGATALLLAACDGGNPDTGAGGGGGAAPIVRPADPAVNDPAFAVVGAPAYVLAGDDLTPATATFEIRVTAPAGVKDVDLWLDDDEVAPLTPDGADFVVAVDAASLEIGDHHLMLGERGAETGFFGADFRKGHALYVVISTDWDFPDVSDEVLANHDAMHMAHPELKITHLLGPYTYTDPSVSEARRDEITAWAKGMRDSFGDEIGLHIHPRCSFVEAAGVTCLFQPSVAYPAGDNTGYTVRLGAYSRQEWDAFLQTAEDLWSAKGFGKPTSFRAGAWTLEAHVAAALSDAGFLADSSAVNWPYLEEWEGYDLYSWNQAQWGPIGDTSQPYVLTEDSVLPGGTGVPLTMLEIPDNGIMVDYWTVAEITAIFQANWSGQALQAPTQMSTGFHPAPAEYYSPAEYERLDAFFSLADGSLASKLAGPVIYITMTDAAKVW